MPTKIFKNNPRFNFGILLILLILSVVGTFFSLHNHIVRATGNTPVLGVLLTIFAVLIALIMYQQLKQYKGKLGRVHAELNQLKEAINRDIKETKEEESLDDNTSAASQIEFKQEASNLIPTKKFSTTEKFLEKLLSDIAKKHDIVQAIAFEKRPNEDLFQIAASYAYFSETEGPTFTEGVSLPGQVAKNKAVLNLTEVPPDYITVLSGLGKGSPSHLLIVPILDNEQRCNGVIELSSFKAFDENQIRIFENLGIILGEQIKSIGNSTEK